MNIRFFDGQVEEFVCSLDESTSAKVLRVLDLLEMFGSRLNLPHSKKVHARLFELRIRGKQEVRVLYAFYGGEAVLLHGFMKKSQRIPKREISLALQKLGRLD